MLYKLRLYPEKSGITGMTDKEIWESSELFKCYPLDDFTKYDKKMIKLTKKRREMVQQQHRDFEQDVANFPPSQRTNRGEPFWHRHAANTLFKEDVESGTANLMTPGELWGPSLSTWSSSKKRLQSTCSKRKVNKERRLTGKLNAKRFVKNCEKNKRRS